MQIQLLSPFPDSDVPKIYKELRSLRRLRVSVFGPTAPATSSTEEQFVRAGRWIQDIENDLEGAAPFSILLCRIPYRLSREAAYRLKEWWLQLRSRGEEPAVHKALAFVTSRDEIPRDLAFLWSRARHVEAPDERDLALIAVNRRQGAVVVEAPIKGRMAQVLQDLPLTPVVSSELLARSSSGDEGISLWSKRVEALRRMGLVVPLPEWLPEYATMKEAHARALGRSVDRRRTRLHRSVLHDLFWHLSEETEA